MSDFTPRTSRYSPTSMTNNPWWYSNARNPYLTWYNRFYNTGNGLPNCTCYAYGRYAEIKGNWEPFAQTNLGRESVMLPRGNGGDWWGQATNPNNKYYIGDGNFGQTPALGAVICWHDPTGRYAGHVAIVEQILDDGRIWTSNSAYGGEYFYMAYRNAADNYYIPYHNGAYRFQGFLYNTSSPVPPTPPPITARNLPIWMMVDYNDFY